MKTLLSIIAMILSLNSFAITACGEGSEKQDKNLDWSKLTNIHLDSSMVTMSGILCVGIDPTTHSYKKIIYRDNIGNNITNDVERLKDGMVLFSYADLDDKAKAILKDANYITLRLVSVSKNQESAPLYSLAIKFLRKFAKVSLTDYRTMYIDTSYWPSRYNTYTYSRDARMWFDTIDIGIQSFPPSIDSIEFESSWDGAKRKISATNLGK